MVIVPLTPKIPENYNAFCSASKSNKLNLRHKTLDLPSFAISTQRLLKTTLCLHKARVCPTGFGATFALVFALFYWLREFPQECWLCFDSVLVQSSN